MTYVFFIRLEAVDEMEAVGKIDTVDTANKNIFFQSTASTVLATGYKYYISFGVT